MGVISRLYTFVNGAGNKIDATQVNAELNQILGVLNGNVDNANLAAGAAAANLGAGSVTDAKLASSPLAQYKVLAEGRATLPGSTGTGTAYAAEQQDGGAPTIAPGNNLHATPLSPLMVPIVRIAATDLAVPGKTTYLRFVGTSMINNTATGAAVATLGLHPITAVTGATSSELFVTWSNTRTGTGATIPNSAAGAYLIDSGDFSVVTDGYYVAALKVASASVPAGHTSQTSWQLLYRNA